MKKEWIVENNTNEKKSLIERLLNSRGIETEEDIKAFLNPLDMELTSPYDFTDMKKSVERISQAIDTNEKILIYGDFDADGVTSTAILYKTLKYLDADVEYYIPNRETEGHGLFTKSLVKIMTKTKPKVLITVDCGISNENEVKFLNSFKVMDVIITDHHEAPETLPPAYGIINPKAPNSLSENLTPKQMEYLTYLAGCGVAFKVAQAILVKYGKAEFINNIVPFVAVGTVSDIVPLLGENRYFVIKGLDLISRGKHEGLTKLLEGAGYDITKGITSENIAFGVTPRINASGRLDTVDASLKVLISDNMQEVQMAVTTLNELNRVRQTLCKDTFEQADEIYKKQGTKNPAIILAHQDWHIGIIGIVASKFVEKYNKPTFLMNYNPETKEYRCSARSIEGVPLYDVIENCSDLLNGFGGHTLAAGLSFSEDKASFEEVKKALNDTVQEYVKAQDLKPTLYVDLELTPSDVDFDLVEQISKLEPFGASNPSPIFVLNNLKIKQKRQMGTDNAHLRLVLETQGREFTAVWWQNGNANLNCGDIIDIAFHPQINEFNGNISIQLIIDDVHADGLEEVIPPRYKIYDNRTKSGILPTVNDYVKNSKLNIKIFAESKKVTDTIKDFPQLKSNIFTRANIQKCDVVMFFDYPSDKQTLDNILDAAQPDKLHFMKYDMQILDEQEFLKIFTGMVKYSIHHNNGIFELIRCAGFLGKSICIFDDLLALFENYEIIKICEHNNFVYKIEENNFENTQKILNSNEYSEIFDKTIECEKFQRHLLEDDLDEIFM